MLPIKKLLMLPLAIVLVVVSACGMINGDTTLTAPVLSSTSFNSTAGDHFYVSITLGKDSPSDTKIYYTTDGSDPKTSGTALEYSTPVDVGATSGYVTLKAVSKFYGLYSTEATGSYWFGDWEFVGKTYLGGAASGHPATIFVENNVPYVAHKVVGENSLEVNTLVSGEWTTLPTITDITAFLGGKLNSNLFVVSGTPYVLYMTLDGLTASKYVSGAWTNIGTAISNDDILDAALFVENGTVYVATIEHLKPFAYYYDGANWVKIGGASIDPTATVTKVFLSVKNGTPYVGFNDTHGELLQLKKFNGTSWNSMGNIGAVAFPSFDFDFAIYDDGSTDGKIYVVYNSSGGNHMKVYNGSSWTALLGINGEVEIEYPKLNVKDDVPYLTYVHADPDTLETQVVTKRFYNSAWSDVGTISYLGNNVLYAPSAAVAEDGTMYQYYTVKNASWAPLPGMAVVESFGPNGSGVPAHVEDPVSLIP